LAAIAKKKVETPSAVVLNPSSILSSCSLEVATGNVRPWFAKHAPLFRSCSIGNNDPELVPREIRKSGLGARPQLGSLEIRNLIYKRADFNASYQPDRQGSAGSVIAAGLDPDQGT
jgi:hypothetical protein